MRTLLIIWLAHQPAFMERCIAELAPRGTVIERINVCRCALDNLATGKPCRP